MSEKMFWCKNLGLSGPAAVTLSSGFVGGTRRLKECRGSYFEDTVMKGLALSLALAHCFAVLEFPGVRWGGLLNCTLCSSPLMPRMLSPEGWNGFGDLAGPGIQSLSGSL